VLLAQVMNATDSRSATDAHRALDRRRWPVEVDGVADRWRSRGNARGGGSMAVLRAPGLRGSARGLPAIELG